MLPVKIANSVSLASSTFKSFPYSSDTIVRIRNARLSSARDKDTLLTVLLPKVKVHMLWSPKSMIYPNASMCPRYSRAAWSCTVCRHYTPRWWRTFEVMLSYTIARCFLCTPNPARPSTVSVIALIMLALAKVSPVALVIDYCGSHI